MFKGALRNRHNRHCERSAIWCSLRSHGARSICSEPGNDDHVAGHLDIGRISPRLMDHDAHRVALVALGPRTIEALLPSAKSVRPPPRSSHRARSSSVCRAGTGLGGFTHNAICSLYGRRKWSDGHDRRTSFDRVSTSRAINRVSARPVRQQADTLPSGARARFATTRVAPSHDAQGVAGSNNVVVAALPPRSARAEDLEVLAQPAIMAPRRAQRSSQRGTDKWHKNSSAPSSNRWFSALKVVPPVSV